MKKELKITLASLPDGIFFLILFLYQILFIFQGLDFADEGFHATFYQQIFTNPASMVANFMYWLTGIVGGSFYYLFPNLGLIGLRIQGVFIIFGSLIVTYYLLKKYLDLVNLRISILILAFFTTNEIKEMHYDTLAAVFNVLAVMFLFKGLTDKSGFKLAIGGVCVSLSMFTRVPSIVLLMLASAIIYYGITNNNSWKEIFRNCFMFCGGFLVMTFFVLLFMKLIGHLNYYFETLKIVFAWGSSSEDSHNAFQLVKNFIRDYSQSLKYGLIVIAGLYVLALVDNYRSKTSKILSNSTRVLTIMLPVLLIIYMVLRNHLTYAKMIMIFTGLSLIVSLIILTNKNSSKELKLLTFLGCLIIFLGPLGSAWGLSTMGRHSLWIILPIALNFIYTIKKLDGKFLISTNTSVDEVQLSTFPSQIRNFKLFFTTIIIGICIYFSYYYPYFDLSDRINMSSAIHNKLAKGIYTTRERAGSINELLEESAKYIKKDDFVLAYDCIPMFHFLTETRPYIPSTWPWLYVPSAFEQELYKSQKMHHELPVLILQKLNTLNNNWPQNYQEERIRTGPEQARDSILNVFIVTNNYKKVWENITFEILLP